MPPASGEQLTPCGSGVGAPPQLLLAAEAIEHLELVGGPREAPLLELPGHRHDALDRRSDILARGSAAPRECAGAPAGRDTARDEERVLVVGPQLAELVELVWQPKLRLDIRLVACRPDEGLVALRAEQQADRLREDRLARPGLTGDRVQAGCEVELGLPDEHQVLDPEPEEHEAMVERR